jgi:small-conductance mechanosensitive channel
MLDTIKWSTFLEKINTVSGIVEIVLTILCFALAYGISLWIFKKIKGTLSKTEGYVFLTGGLLRLIFPTLALVLVLIARSAYAAYAKPFFLHIALPLAVALFVIRIATYMLHSTVPKATWLKTSDRAVSLTIWVLVVLYFLGVLGEVGKELNSLVLPIGKGISVLSLFESIIVIGIAVTITLWISSMIERKLLSFNESGGISYNGRLFFVRVLRAALLVIAVLIAMQSLGIDLTIFAVLGGAVGVGIGFGFQKIAANYISGFVVLIEKSIKIGDMVTVGSHYGEVKEIGARYVVVRSPDGINALIPNENLLTNTVFNHSANQREARTVLPVSVAYGTDLPFALSLMTKAANEQSRVITEGARKPVGLVTSFGDSGIDLSLAIWVRDPENGSAGLKSAINLRIWELFSENNISIPFPQREVRML